LRTPGHTLESSCYLVDAACLLTGDTLFLAAVGRPDLHANEDEARKRALSLCQSLCRVRSLPPELLVLPGHTSRPVPFDGVPIMATLEDVFLRMRDWFALPIIAERQFGLASRASILSFLVSFGLVKAAANLFAGRASDHLGRKRVLVAGWLFGLAGSLPDRVRAFLGMDRVCECAPRA
jgi:glyoxylase-like metal-dependent hydrolase (beta-lactamase superfamily II)